MEYAKDMIFNVKYDNGTNIIRLKKEGYFKRLTTRIYENKFILTVLALVMVLATVDTILITSFIGLLSKLG